MTRSRLVRATPEGTDSRSNASTAVQRLDQAPQGRLFTVRQVHPDPQVPERARQLEEIGFFPGEQVMVITRGFPSGDPIAVRIGQSTFALRGSEAACVQVDPVPDPAPA